MSSSCISFIGNSIKGGTIGINIDTNGLCQKVFIKDNVIDGATTGTSVKGGITTLVLQGNNDFSTTTSYSLADTITDAIIKDNTYTASTGVTATFAGNTTFVEQLKP